MSTKLRYGLPVLFEGLNQADCRDVFTFWDDFLDSSMSIADEVSRWKSTIVGGGTVGALMDATDASQEYAGGVVQLANGGTVSDTSSMLVNGESFQLAEGHELYFECRWSKTEIVGTSTFCGLSSSIETCIGSLTNGIGFLTVTSALYTSVGKTTQNIDTISGVTIAANGWNRGAIHFDGIDTVKFYFAQGDAEMVEVNSLSLTTTAHYIPDDIMLTPTLESECEAGTGNGLMYVDYVLCQQARQRVAD